MALEDGLISDSEEEPMPLVTFLRIKRGGSNALDTAQAEKYPATPRNSDPTTHDASFHPIVIEDSQEKVYQILPATQQPPLAESRVGTVSTEGNTPVSAAAANLLKNPEIPGDPGAQSADPSSPGAPGAADVISSHVDLPEPAESAPDAAAAPTAPEIPLRRFRKRKERQLHPYKYDAMIYGSFNDYSDPHSPPQSPAYDVSSSLPSSPVKGPKAPKERTKIIYSDGSNSVDSDGDSDGSADDPLMDLDSDAGDLAMDLDSSPRRGRKRGGRGSTKSHTKPQRSRPVPRAKFRIIDDDEPQDTLGRQTEGTHLGDEASDLGDSDPCDSDSDGSSASASGSSAYGSAMEAPVTLDYMLSRSISRLPRKARKATDFMRIAVRSAKRAKPRSSAAAAKPAAFKYIRHDRRQSHLTFARAQRAKRATGASEKDAKRPLQRPLQRPLILAPRQTNPKVSTPAHPLPPKSGLLSTFPLTPLTRTSKRSSLQELAKKSRKRRRYAPPHRGYSTILEVEDGTYVYPPGHQPPKEPDSDPEELVLTGRGKKHRFWDVQPVPLLPFAKSTFLGSNLLTLLDVPEPFDGVSGHEPIISEQTTPSALDSNFDLHKSYMIDDNIEQVTYQQLYSYYFQLASELIRPDVLVSTETYQHILERSTKILQQLLDQIDSPPVTTRARLMFAVFALCAGYGGVQVGLDELYLKIQDQAVSLLLHHLRVLRDTLSSRPRFDCNYVAFELVLVLYKLGTWTKALESGMYSTELTWQLVFIDACARRYLRVEGASWANVLPLLDPKRLKTRCLASIQRCITLVRVWRWPPSRDVPSRLFDYLARHKKYADPGLEAIEIPALVKGDFSGQLPDTEFAAFLELLGMTLHRFHGTELVALRNRVTPMSIWEAPRDGVSMELISGAIQRIGIMLVLTKACPAGVRPPVEQVLGIVKVENSPVVLRTRILSAWAMLAQIVRTPHDLRYCERWIGELVRATAAKYREAKDSDKQYHARTGDLDTFFLTLSRTLLSLPNAAQFYTSEMITPLLHTSSAKLQAALWTVVQQLPTRTLEHAYPTIQQYFQRHSEPMHIWVQVLGRLGIANLQWPYESEPSFLAELIRKVSVRLDAVAPKALEFVARPSWHHNEQHFFGVLRSVYKLQFRIDRAEIAAAVVLSRTHAELLLKLLDRAPRDSGGHTMDRYEREMYKNMAARLRIVCFEKFPEMAKNDSYRPSNNDQVKASIQGYLSQDKLLTLEYFIGHKLRAALVQRDTSLFLQECLPVLLARDSRGPRAFNVIVNQIFRYYVWLGVTHERMRACVPLFVQIVLLATNFSDRLAYDPLPFMESMAYFTRDVINSRRGWHGVALFMKLGASCVRQLHVRGSVGPWQPMLDELRQLAKWVREARGGREFRVPMPALECEGQISVMEDLVGEVEVGDGEDVVRWCEVVERMLGCGQDVLLSVP